MVNKFHCRLPRILIALPLLYAFIWIAKTSQERYKYYTKCPECATHFASSEATENFSPLFTNKKETETTELAIEVTNLVLKTSREQNTAYGWDDAFTAKAIDAEHRITKATEFGEPTATLTQADRSASWIKTPIKDHGLKNILEISTGNALSTIYDRFRSKAWVWQELYPGDEATVDNQSWKK
jgi:hypothetical protein